MNGVVVPGLTDEEQSSVTHLRSFVLDISARKTKYNGRWMLDVQLTGKRRRGDMWKQFEMTWRQLDGGQRDGG